MTNEVLVFAEIRGGEFKKINLELVTVREARGKSGGAVHLALLGGSIDKAVGRPSRSPSRECT